MNIQNTFRKYMIPFLKENGFRLVEKLGNEFIYQHNEETNACISFTVNLKEKKIGVEFYRKDRKSYLPSYRLSLFLEDPEFPDTTILDGEWYFDDEKQLTGALEEQVMLLREKGIPWLMGYCSINLEENMLESSRNREKKWNSSTEEERKMISMQFDEIFDKWENRRVYPKEWSMNPEES